MKFKDWLQEWLTLYVKASVKENTYDRYEIVVRIHLVPSLGEREISEITATDLQKFIIKLSTRGNYITCKGLSPNTIDIIISVLRSALKQAMRLGILNSYCASELHRPRAKEKKMESFSLNEQKRIEKYVLLKGDDKQFGIVLSLYTGLRIGELLALEWTDIDFGKSLLYVTKACHDGKGGRVTDTPKTGSSNRVVPIPKQLISMLKACKRRSNSKYVISFRNEGVSVRSYQKLYAGILCKLGIPHQGFHALRHTFATRALECGMDVKTLAEILGHKNPTITLNRYVHSLLEHKTEMMNRLGKLFL